MAVNEQHIANRLKYSLRVILLLFVILNILSLLYIYAPNYLYIYIYFVMFQAYLSVLYLKLPDTFAMVLRGKVVLYHNIATDLKHTEFIMYKPHTDGRSEVVFIIIFLIIIQENKFLIFFH